VSLDLTASLMIDLADLERPAKLNLSISKHWSTGLAGDAAEGRLVDIMSANLGSIVTMMGSDPLDPLNRFLGNLISGNVPDVSAVAGHVLASALLSNPNLVDFVVTSKGLNVVVNIPFGDLHAKWPPEPSGPAVLLGRPYVVPFATSVVTDLGSYDEIVTDRLTNADVQYIVDNYCADYLKQGIHVPTNAEFFSRVAVWHEHGKSYFRNAFWMDVRGMVEKFGDGSDYSGSSNAFVGGMRG
ncbi:MAG: hypothetical protein WCP21_13480, partial [Armatimonadota bacterium]